MDTGERILRRWESVYTGIAVVGALGVVAVLLGGCILLFHFMLRSEDVLMTSPGFFAVIGGCAGVVVAVVTQLLFEFLMYYTLMRVRSRGDTKLLHRLVSAADKMKVFGKSWFFKEHWGV